MELEDEDKACLLKQSLYGAKSRDVFMRSGKV